MALEDNEITGTDRATLTPRLLKEGYRTDFRLWKNAGIVLKLGNAWSATSAATFTDLLS